MTQDIQETYSDTIYHIKIGLRCSECYQVIEDSLPPGHQRMCENCSETVRGALGPPVERAS